MLLCEQEMAYGRERCWNRTGSPHDHSPHGSADTTPGKRGGGRKDGAAQTGADTQTTGSQGHDD